VDTTDDAVAQLNVALGTVHQLVGGSPVDCNRVRTTGRRRIDA